VKSRCCSTLIVLPHPCLHARGYIVTMSDLKSDETATGIVPVLSCVLNQLCVRNDKNPAVSSNQYITKFHALRPPAITIKDYLHRIAKYAACSGECFVLCLVYIDRIIQSNPNFVVTSLNIHRLLITSIMLSAKFFDDQYYNNAYYAKVGGVPPLELNNLEVEFLFMCNFTLYVSSETYTQYYTELFNHANNMNNTACQCAQGPKVPVLQIPQYSSLSPPPYDLSVPHSFYYVLRNEKQLLPHQDIHITPFNINAQEELDAHGQITKANPTTPTQSTINQNQQQISTASGATKQANIVSRKSHPLPQPPVQSSSNKPVSVNVTGGLMTNSNTTSAAAAVGHQRNYSNNQQQSNHHAQQAPAHSANSTSQYNNLNQQQQSNNQQTTPNNAAMAISPATTTNSSQNAIKTPTNTAANPASAGLYRSGGLATQSGSINAAAANKTNNSSVSAAASAVLNVAGAVRRPPALQPKPPTADIHMSTGSPVIKQ
jgi:hypothetical protein